jgi:hypothetical protein
MKENFGIVSEAVRIKLEHYCKTVVMDGDIIKSEKICKEEDGRLFVYTKLNTDDEYQKEEVVKCPICSFNLI